MIKFKKEFITLVILLIAMLTLIACSAEPDPELKEIVKNLATDVVTELAEKVEENQLEDEGKLSEQAGKNQLTAESLLVVHFLDVGQADSILVQSGKNFMLIDAGNNDDVNFVVQYLKKQGVSKLDYVVGTHPHEDHIGGLDAVIESFEIGKVLMPKVTHTTKTFEDVLKAIKSKGLKISSPTPGSVIEIGEAKVQVLAPNSKSYESLNDYSIVLRLEHGKNRFLFTGDAEEVSEKEMLDKGYQLASDVLKVAHHGSSTSTSTAFLKKVNPTYAVIFVGKNNDYGHPHQETLDKLKKNKVKILRTDETGTIVCVSDGETVSFKNLSID